jgi:hypothetical protein
MVIVNTLLSGLVNGAVLKEAPPIRFESSCRQRTSRRAELRRFLAEHPDDAAVNRAKNGPASHVREGAGVRWYSLVSPEEAHPNQRGAGARHFLVLHA